MLHVIKSGPTWFFADAPFYPTLNGAIYMQSVVLLLPMGHPKVTVFKEREKSSTDEFVKNDLLPAIPEGLLDDKLQVLSPDLFLYLDMTFG